MIGTTLSHYRIVEKIGEGGMGEVYRAHDERLDRDVAIKVLHEDVAQDADRLARFEREAKAVAKLEHPNILAIYDFGTDRGVTYAVMELLDGQNLRQAIPASGMPWQKVVEMGAAIADGLAAAHGKGIVHRDLKPENVFMTSDGRVKVLDFGLAQVKAPVDEEAETATLTPAGTVPGSVLGTMGYMSPEQLRGEPADARSDIFALGCVLYEMLSGQIVFLRNSMAEEIINALAHLDGLRVIARTSSFAFKDKPQDIREIGDALDVQHLLEGSVRRAGDRLRITAQLIDVRDGSHLWSERYDRRLEDVFAIQDEIALAVVKNLEVKLLGGERAAVTRRHTDNLEAHNAYLVGLFEWNKMTPEGFVRCQELFQEAIDLDPEFAPPYARLADSFSSVTWWADLAPAEALAKARPLVEKALALDPGLAHAHSVLGQYSSFFERDWTAGERSMRRAAELAPNDALVQTYLAILLMMAGRGAEASERARTALRLDPLSPANTVWAGTALLFSGHADEGLSVIERQATTTPHLWMPSYWLSVGLANGGRFAEAKAAGEKAVELSGGSSVTQCNLAMICYHLGEKETGDSLFDGLRQRALDGYVSPMFLAWLHLTRGEPEDALRRVEEALAAKDPWVGPQRVMYRTIMPADPLVDDLLASALP